MRQTTLKKLRKLRFVMGALLALFLRSLNSANRNSGVRWGGGDRGVGKKSFSHVIHPYAQKWT